MSLNKIKPRSHCSAGARGNVRRAIIVELPVLELKTKSYNQILNYKSDAGRPGLCAKTDEAKGPSAGGVLKMTLIKWSVFDKISSPPPRTRTSYW